MSHDQNFKNLILDYPHLALAFFAATEADGIDAARITPVRQEQFQERLGERFRELDVPLLVEWPNGRREALAFVLEEESDARRFSIHRLAHYCLDLAELMKTDRVVPVVIFLRQAQGVAQRLCLSGDHHTYLDFRYLSCALGELAYEHYRHSDNLVIRLNLPNMQYPAGRKVEVYAQAVRGLTGLERDPEKQLKYLDFIDIYAALDDNERVEYQRDYPDEARTMSRFAERFREEGIQQGMQQGLQQGMQQGVQQGKHQGEALVLERLLRLKFGTLPDEVQQRIDQASEQTLLAWSERVLTANRLDEVLH
ncbi:DUF4351 domain-containing protein [Candidatus Thiosymbion oneisti]|uniref:DUF4351 domain-containing protein n=1 Tax=Candidatus Thiosymbion oneisti TaxID=589554 RepID=UPI000B7D79DA|nr:DUF4351 domain-containing protein [Candidatus Thiosymbion oneisti]